MKAFLIGIIFLVVVGVAGYFGVRYLGSQEGKMDSQVYKTESITREGMLQASSVAGTDYNHVIMSGGKYYGVTSNTEDLDEFVGKKVRATGQNSGDTLYADTVAIIP